MTTKSIPVINRKLSPEEREELWASLAGGVAEGAGEMYGEELPYDGEQMELPFPKEGK